MRAYRNLAWPFLMLLVTAIGCGYPQVQPHNLELTVKLRTAVSAQNEEWLAMNESLVEEQRRAGAMSDEEYEAFQEIIALARDGRWEDAETRCVRLQAAQSPPPERQAQMGRMQQLSRPQ